MPEALPIFPLNTVLFPGMTIPLHVFEQRYKSLVAELLGPAPAEVESGRPERGPVRFGVVWIELGREVAGESGQGALGADTGAPRAEVQGRAPSLPLISAVGCTAVVRDVRTYEDGRYDLVVEGGTRFRIRELSKDAPSSPDAYSTASISLLPEALGPDAEEHADRVRDLYQVYLGRLSEIGMAPETSHDLPRDPIGLSHSAAALIVLDPAEKQRLLEAENAATRLALLTRFLRRENRIVAAPTLPNLPAGPFLDHGVSFN